MSIDYFSDIEFVCHGDLRHSTAMTFRDDFDYWGLQFSRRGHFVLEINGNAEYTRDACVFVSAPGMSFRYGAVDPAEGIEDKIYICFKGERIRRYLSGGLLVPRKQHALIKLTEPDKFMRRMRSIRALLMLPYSVENHARAVLALEELLLAMQSAETSANSRADVRYQTFAELTEKISSRPELHWDFEKEARKLSVSYAHFRRLFEQFFQVPPGAFLLAARLEKAAALLSGSDLRVREIAGECGFEDEFYFSRIFKKYRQLSPKKYRENCRKQA